MPLPGKQPADKTTPVVAIETEEERLRRDIFRPDIEKFRLLTQMFRTNALYKKAKITHELEKVVRDAK